MSDEVVVGKRPVVDKPRWRYRRKTRLWLLTAHIALSVGLLGDSAGFLAVAVRHVTTTTRR